MFHCKIIFLIFVSAFAPHLGWAQEQETQDVMAEAPSRTNRKGQAEYKSFALSYTSWTEFVDLESGSLEDNTHANFYGLQLTYERESFNLRWGIAKEVSLIFGQANLGGRQNLIPYQATYRPWYGLEASYRGAYRVSPQITLSMGPFALFRQVTWPDSTGVTVISGSPVNIGLLADAKLRLTPQWELRQMIGTLFFKGSTIWSFGFGYKY